MYTLKDIAKMTQMTPRTIQNYLAKGILKGLKVGGQWRFTEEQVKTFFDNASVAGLLAQQSEEAIHGYLQEPKVDASTNMSMCVVWHVFASQAEVQIKVEDLTAYIKANIKGGLNHFSYTYDIQQRAGRFVAIGAPTIVKEIIEAGSC